MSEEDMEKKRNIRETRELTAIYDQESKGYRRFKIDEGQGIRGMLYFPKDEPVPRMVSILLRQDEGRGQGRGR